MLIGLDASRAVTGRAAGVGHYSRNLLAVLVRRGDHRYRLYANGAARPDWADWPAAEWRDIPLARLWTHVRLSAELAQRRPDALFVPGHVLPPIRPRASVVTIHDLGHLYYPRTHPTRQRLYLHLATIWNAHAASVVLADSQATALDIERFLRLPASKVVVAYPGVTADFAPQSQSRLEEARRAYRLPPDYLLCVGTIQPRKNIARLLLAHEQVPQAPPLVFAGAPGWLSTELLPRIEARGGRTRLLGYVPDEDLPALMAGARALLFPSLHEGFGIPALEAMACGTPVIASRASSLPEVVGDAGLLVDPLSPSDIAAAIVTICSDRGYAAALGEAGRRRAGEFTWERCAKVALAAIETAHAQR